MFMHKNVLYDKRLIFCDLLSVKFANNYWA